MAECIICDIVESKIPSKKIYEDDEVIAFLDYNGASEGHSFIVPKQHIPIFEQVPDALVSKLFSVANKISSALFDTLGAQGTNIFVTNGISAGQSVAHFVVNVIPRKEKDGINLQWQPKQLSEEEMSTVELRVKESIERLDDGPKKETKKEVRESISADDDNWLWKSVNKRWA